MPKFRDGPFRSSYVADSVRGKLMKRGKIYSPAIVLVVLSPKEG